MNSLSSKLAITLATGLAAVGLSTQAYANPGFPNPIIPTNVVFPTGTLHLSDLIPHDGVIPAVQVFDKVFYNFGYVKGGLSMPTANNITVAPKITNVPAWGLEF